MTSSFQNCFFFFLEPNLSVVDTHFKYMQNIQTPTRNTRTAVTVANGVHGGPGNAQVLQQFLETKDVYSVIK